MRAYSCTRIVIVLYFYIFQMFKFGTVLTLNLYGPLHDGSNLTDERSRAELELGCRLFGSPSPCRDAMSDAWNSRVMRDSISKVDVRSRHAIASTGMQGVRLLSQRNLELDREVIIATWLPRSGTSRCSHQQIRTQLRIFSASYRLGPPYRYFAVAIVTHGYRVLADVNVSEDIDKFATRIGIIDIWAL